MFPSLWLSRAPSLLLPKVASPGKAYIAQLLPTLDSLNVDRRVGHQLVVIPCLLHVSFILDLPRRSKQAYAGTSIAAGSILFYKGLESHTHRQCAQDGFEFECPHFQCLQS